eukprot:CAMPEP_0170566722 /NCGR_PEP_ID=MMETSP0211-20121228/80021_1 /TAXON_ID=311385 /ORGANISM="Pseudokeronopsis sp., Strain OXSARD2" /LENGTH=103 /DNA_ID=CAMNT_0010887975 /DNA_START=820 /DNA_END=1131 /DNA_ORIENTATION=+
MEIFNEICVLAASYHLFFFTDTYDDKEFQYRVGWTLILVTVFNVLINLIIIVKETIQTMKEKFKILRTKIKERCQKNKKAPMYSHPNQWGSPPITSRKSGLDS